MKTIYIFLGFILLPMVGFTQENIFHDRDFWRAQPNIEQIKTEIDHGNDPTELNPYMFDATVYALLEHANIEVLKFLLTIPGNEVDKITHDGRNYLLWAGYAGDYENVKYLIDLGSDVHHIDEHGYGLVTFTAIGGTVDTNIYDLYLDNGLQMDETNRSGANALLLSASSVDSLEDLTYFLEKGLSINDEDDKGNNIFLYATSKGHIPFLKQLVQAKVNYQKVNDDGANAVIAAARGARRHANNVEVFEYLNDLGISLNQKDKDGNSALHYAAYSNPNKGVFEYLIQQGVSPLSENNDGSLALFNAVKYKNKVATEVLLPYVESYDYANQDGMTLLSSAIQGGNESVTSQLLEKNINLNHLSNNNESYINLLFKNYKKRNKAYFEKFFPIFGAKGIKPTINSDNGNTIFHIAVDKNNIYLIEKAQLISDQINVANAKGLTPLQLAAMKAKDTKILLALIKFGADKQVKTDFDESVYDLAKENEALKNMNLEFLK